MATTTLHTAPRPRSYVAVRGPDAASYLERMLSNEVEALPVGEACQALLLTAKARLVALTTVWRRGADDFLLLTDPATGEALRTALTRTRFAARCEITAEEHVSTLVLGLDTGGIPNRDYGIAAVELLDAEPPAAAEPIDADGLERLRILARTPAVGRELDERVMPAEAGLDERAISFTKGCYPGQEPVARLHYRGHPNRTLRVLELEGDELPEYDAELSLDGKVVGRVTSTAPDPEHGIVALAYVRREITPDAVLALADGRSARQLG